MKSLNFNTNTKVATVDGVNYKIEDVKVQGEHSYFRANLTKSPFTRDWVRIPKDKTEGSIEFDETASKTQTKDKANNTSYSINTLLNNLSDADKAIFETMIAKAKASQLIKDKQNLVLQLANLYELAIDFEKLDTFITTTFLPKVDDTTTDEPKE